MHKYILIFALIAVSCTGQNKKNSPNKKPIPESIQAPDFKLIKAKKQQGLLVLFPCFSCNAKNTLNAFDIADISVKNGFSVLAMNLNKRLYLKPKEKRALVKLLTNTIREQNLPGKNIFIGGFSSGGNVALLLCDYLKKNNSQIQPKGVFVVDSPVDLLGLYKTAEKNLKLNFSESAVRESTWIKALFDKEFGKPASGLANYERSSPFTYTTQNIENLKGLENLKIRFYTEPDVKWWNDHAQNDYKDLNAFYIEKLADQLKTAFGKNNVELIKTKNRGHRADGRRRPHSWSIVNENDLVDWMTE